MSGTPAPQAASASLLPDGITDSDYQPAPGRLGNLTVPQQHALEKFKKELQEEGYLDAERMTDAYLLRFLRARKFDVVKAKEMLINAEKWRKEFGVDEIVKTFEFTEKPKVNEIYPQFYHKIDIDGQPVYIEQLGKLRLDELYRITSPERLLQNLVNEYEKSTSQRIPACVKAIGHPVETYCTIMDLKGVSLTSFYSVKDHVMAAAAIGQDRYPETMGKFYIVNAPWTFTAVWAIIKPWLDEVTTRKIQILGSSYQAELLKQIPKENLPREFGGDCACEGGCSMSDAGPWKNEA